MWVVFPCYGDMGDPGLVTDPLTNPENPHTLPGTQNQEHKPLVFIDSNISMPRHMCEPQEASEYF